MADRNLKIGRIQVCQRVQVDGPARRCSIRAVSSGSIIITIIIIIIVRRRSSGIRLQLHSRAGRRIDAKRSFLVLADLQNRHIHHNFWLRSIQITYQFLRKCDLVRCASDYNRSFRRQRLDALNLQNLAQGVDYIL